MNSQWTDRSTNTNRANVERSVVDRLKRLRWSAAAFAAALGLLVLIGWGFNLDWLTRPALGMTAANPMTAVAIAAAALALVLSPRRHPIPAGILTSFILGIGAIRLAAILTGLPLAIDQMLFTDQLGRFGRVADSLMPSATAFSLILIGGALLLSRSRDRHAVLAAQLACVVVIAMAWFVVVGDALDLFGLDGVIRLKMALYTALPLIGLAVGTASISTESGLTHALLDRGVTGSLARAALPFTLIATVLLATEDGTALQVFTNLTVTIALLAGCGIALLYTDRARRHRELIIARSGDRYRLAEQVAHIGHWLVEYPTGTVTWSEEYYKICGLPHDTEPTIETALALNHPDDAVAAREIAQAVKDGRGWEIGLRIRRPDGDVRYIKSHGVCEHAANGDVTAIFGVFADVTELEFAQREAEAATASKAAFLANMSHEIRTPMNGVMGFVELLMESKLDAKQRRHLVLVQESAQALLKLLNDILDLSKIEANQLDLSAEPSNVRHDITQCVRLMTPIAEQKGLDLRVEFDENFPPSVLVDSLRLRQILFNLLGNSVKFTNKGSVVVTLGEVSDPEGRRIIEIGVADTGAGIAEDRKMAIFDAFVQADVSISRRFGGSGLGLSISRRLARLMGGTLMLASEEGEGTIVTLRLPLDEVFAPSLVDAALVPAISPPVADADEPAQRHASILLVEDIDINQELVTEMLIRLGHRVDLATNGAEALALAHRLETEPGAWDLILMDVQMPVMDGITATRAIRALGGRATTIPIVALTANAFAAEMQECHDAGMNDHITKPSGFAQLKRAVELWGDVVPSTAPATGFRDLAKVSIADRFETRMRKSHERLIELVAALCDAKEDAATPLMREAAGIAHVLAGTAGMFGQAGLGNVAQQVEGEINAMSRDDPTPSKDKARQVIGKLVTALGATAHRTNSALPVAA
jgi:signal transduction histidine kinase/CheY-like chemotaxis protein/HPt (histidine-containing phosphotransfer) domain-containing protein